MFDKLLAASIQQPATEVVATTQPFPAGGSGHYFVGDADRVQRLNLLTHLLPSGGVLLVLGEGGVGKSALLRQLLLRASDSCRVCQLSASASIDPRQALREMLDCFAWQADVDRSLGGAQVRILREHLGILRRNGYAPVLIIDDAEALPDTILGLLEQLFDVDNTDLLTLVLVGDGSLKQRLALPLMQGLNEHVCHELELLPFSEVEQAGFIRQQMEQLGLEGMGPFHASALKFIYAASAGMPRRINELARAVWNNQKVAVDARKVGRLGRLISIVSLSWLKLPSLRQLRYVLPLLLLSSAAAMFHQEIRSALFPLPASALMAAANGLVDARPLATITTQFDGGGESSLAINSALDPARESPSDLLRLGQTQTVHAEADLPLDLVATAAVMGAVLKPVQAIPVEPATELATALSPPAPKPDVAQAAMAGDGLKTELITERLSSSMMMVVDNAAKDVSVPALTRSIASPNNEAQLSKQGAADSESIVAVQPKPLLENRPESRPEMQAQLQIASLPRILPTIPPEPQSEAQPVPKAAPQLASRLKSQSLLPVQAETANMASRIVADMAAGRASTEPEPSRQGGKLVPAQVAESMGGWWLTQPAGQFAVQLLAMEEQVVKAYIQRHELRAEVQTFAVHVGRDKQQLLAAALGPFASQAKAAAAAQQWQARLPDIKPWVRSIGSIQQAVKDYRQQQRPTWLSLVAKHEQQLLQRPAQGYVVQLMAMDQAAVTQFVKKHGLSDQVVYFRTHSGGQELYAALLGSFSSHQQALDAGHEIAVKAIGVRPWVRSLASVQQVIRGQSDSPR